MVREPISMPNPQPEAETANLPITKESHTEVETNVPVPYLDYEQSQGKPYLADHFHLGDTWNDPVGGFPKEISTISNYIEDKIRSGQSANSLSAVQQLLKGLEKVTNTTTEERAVIKLETLSAYVEFLMKTENLKINLGRYNGAR